MVDTVALLSNGCQKAKTSVSDRHPGVVLDAGFTPNKKGQDPIHAEVPKSNKHGNVVTDEDDENNTNLSRIRIIVENIFARLKQWRCLEGMNSDKMRPMANLFLTRQISQLQSTRIENDCSFYICQ